MHAYKRCAVRIDFYVIQYCFTTISNCAILFVSIECYDREVGGLLCDEMGLGKTCQAICFLMSVSNPKRPMSLVLCPLPVLDTWKQEFARYNNNNNNAKYL